MGVVQCLSNVKQKPVYVLKIHDTHTHTGAQRKANFARTAVAVDGTRSL